MSPSYRYNLDWNIDNDSVVDLLRIRHEEIMQSEAQCIKFFDYLLPMIHTAIDTSNQFKAARLLEQLDIKNVTNIPHDNGVLFNIRISEDLSIVIGYGELYASFSYDTEFTLGNYHFQLINFINLRNLPHVRIYVKTPKVTTDAIT